MAQTAYRVLVINGSARKNGVTAKLLGQVVAHLAADGVAVDWLDLYEQHLAPCVGCEACILHTSRCAFDASQSLLERIASYDGLILASPVYLGSVTGQLKILLDKTAWWVHRPQMVGKPALIVSTTAGSKLGYVLRYLEYVAIEWGMQPAGRIGRTRNQDKPVHAREVARFVALLRRDNRAYRPTLREIVSFEVKRVLTRFNDIDGPYWDEQGWTGQPFYYACRLSPLHRLVGWAVRTVLGIVIQPAGER